MKYVYIFILMIYKFSFNLLPVFLVNDSFLVLNFFFVSFTYPQLSATTNLPETFFLFWEVEVILTSLQIFL